jgi:signal transduction histidine kinase
MTSSATPLKRLKVDYLELLRAALGAGVEEVSTAQTTALGQQAGTLGLGTLDVAKIHEYARSQLIAEGSFPEWTGPMEARAAAFFGAVLVPIERDHAPAVRVRGGLAKVKRELKVRTQELATVAQRLRASVARRKQADASLKLSKKRSATLLSGTAAIEVELKAITQQLFVIQEERRKQMSSQLHDKIAVTLLAIHVRLLALQKEAEVNQASLSDEIVTASRLVEQSVRTINHFNREFGIQHET